MERDQDQERSLQQEIVTDCTPSCCNCSPELTTCSSGFVNNRGPDYIRLAGQDFHLYRIQERINDSMQPTYSKEPTSRLRRHVMTNRIMTQEMPIESSMLFRRRGNVSFQKSAFMRRHSRLSTQPFGSLVPEQVAGASLGHHANPLGKPTVYRDEDLDCETHEEVCISGDSDSEKSIDQDRRQKKNTTRSFHRCRNFDCPHCKNHSKFCELM